MYKDCICFTNTTYHIYCTLYILIFDEKKKVLKENINKFISTLHRPHLPLPQESNNRSYPSNEEY